MHRHTRVVSRHRARKGLAEKLRPVLICSEVTIPVRLEVLETDQAQVTLVVGQLEQDLRLGDLHMIVNE